MTEADKVYDYEGNCGDLKIHAMQYTVSGSSETITVSDMTSIKHVHCYINGTEATALDVTISGNEITTAGHSSGDETWDLYVVGI